jgi:hypothetical protein
MFWKKYVCVCVCMYVRVYVCTYVCMYVCVCMYVYVYACICMCMYVYIMYVCNVYAYVCLYTRWFKYFRDDLCVNKSQFVPVIFEPPCSIAHIIWVPYIFMVTTFQSNRDLELKINYLNYSGSFTVTPRNHFLSQINPAKQLTFFSTCVFHITERWEFSPAPLWQPETSLYMFYWTTTSLYLLPVSLWSKFTSWKWNDVSVDLILSKNWKGNESLQKTNRLPKNAGVCTNVCLSGVFVFVPAFYLLITNLYSVQPHECSYISCSDQAIYCALCFFARPLLPLYIHIALLSWTANDTELLTRIFSSYYPWTCYETFCSFPEHGYVFQYIQEDCNLPLYTNAATIMYRVQKSINDWSSPSSRDHKTLTVTQVVKKCSSLYKTRQSFTVLLRSHDLSISCARLIHCTFSCCISPRKSIC